MAEVHVASWQQTYRGLMSDAVLDDPMAVASRERFWTAVLTDARFAQYRAAVAEYEGAVIGIAMSAPPNEENAAWSRHLNVLYLCAAHHGSGAGGDLLDAVVHPTETAALWVAEPNPRAQAFYRKSGFTPNGVVRNEGDVTEIRMVRA